MTNKQQLSRIGSWVTLAIGTSMSFTSANLAQEPLKSRVDRLARPLVDEGQIVGMVVGFRHGSESGIFGYGRTGGEDSTAPDGKTLFEIGSISKVFTGILLADAVQQGTVRLDQEAQELLPAGAKMPSHEGTNILLSHLVTHVSGLPRLPDNFSPADPQNPYRDYDRDKLLSFLGQHQLSRAPGTASEYSNLGMGLVGYLLAEKAGTTYGQLLRDRIAKPLGMDDTTVEVTETQRPRLAMPFSSVETPSASWDFPLLAGCGGIKSTGDDLLKFVDAQLKPPKTPIGTALELAWKQHRKPLQEGDFAMGLGWHIAHDGQTRWHNGETGGYHAMLLINRQIESGVFVLANTASSSVDALAEDLIRMLAGAKVEPREFPKIVAVPASIMQRYVGTYELIPNVQFTVTVDDDKLMAQLTGQPAFQVFPRSETEWFYRVVEASLTFEVDEAGKCHSLTLLQNGITQKAKKLP